MSQGDPQGLYAAGMQRLLAQLEHAVATYAEVWLAPGTAPLELSVVLDLSAGTAKLRSWHLGVPPAAMPPERP